jgi:membrane-bound ClpP family serine protease
MKNTYIALYITASVIFLTALLGGSLTNFIFTGLSSKTLNAAGIKKDVVDSLDSRIDEIFYKMKRVELQIEKFKNIFNDKQIDESKYGKEQNEIFAKSIYNPMVILLNYIFRLTFLLISFIVLLTAFIFYIAYRNYDLRRRIRNLEDAVYGR